MYISISQLRTVTCCARILLIIAMTNASLSRSIVSRDSLESRTDAHFHRGGGESEQPKLALGGIDDVMLESFPTYGKV